MNKLDKSHFLYENIIESMDNGVIALDFEGRVIMFNRAASTMLGIEIKDIMDKFFYEVFFRGEVNNDFIDAIMKAIYAENVNIYQETSYLRPDNTVIPLGMRTSLLKNSTGEDIGIVCVFSNMTEFKNRQFLEDTLSRYVTRQVVDFILASPGSLILDGEVRNCSVLFTDIRGFTTIAEKTNPHELVLLLRAYFTLMVNAIFEHSGTVDKFIGDSVMGVFGAPSDMHDHAIRAARASLIMQESIEHFNSNRVKSGLEPIAVGIGISSGNAIAGNIGSPERFEYTVIGDSVNLASRIQNANKEYGTKILASESTFHCIRDEILCREIDQIRPRGKQQMTTIYEVIGEKEKLPDMTMRMIELYSNGLAMFKSNDATGATACFEAVLKVADDRPSRIYLERCKNAIGG